MSVTYDADYDNRAVCALIVRECSDKYALVCVACECMHEPRLSPH